MKSFNRHDAKAGYCGVLQINCLTLSEYRARITREGYLPLTPEQEEELFPEGDGPISLLFDTRVYQHGYYGA